MHETTQSEAENEMKNPLGPLGAVAAGALAMYYMDPELGERRRALLAELVRSGLPGGQRRPVRGTYARRTYHRITQSDPRSDAELRERVQERVGRSVSFPGAIHVHVQDGVVRLSGRVLAKERDGLFLQIQQEPGVQKLVNALSVHDLPQEIARRQPDAVASEPSAA
jgi:hypothetical protein